MFVRLNDFQGNVYAIFHTFTLHLTLLLFMKALLDELTK